MLDFSNNSVSLEDVGLERNTEFKLAEAESGLSREAVSTLGEFSTSAGDCTLHKTAEKSLSVSDTGGNSDSLSNLKVECASDRVMGRWRIVQGSVAGKVA